ncbi:hypothetical protein DFH07DRAFT_952666 [Mycena maculata]|uniref:SAP domain-containing protein n=1 Tax=Mycena maculata TaxID=230809 RepID=A0AAD7JX68_9AGAR|nr:hypothetical protein DFH07DRAFT_952666 [Mycena maculata]
MNTGHTPVLTLEEIPAGPINNTRNVKQLVGIATAMKISTAGPKPQLLARVLEKLQSDTELAQDTRFIKFSIYRAKAQGRPSKDVRNSSNKATEDAAQDKVDIPATGANKKLLESGAKIDPPAQYGRLTGPLSKGDNVGGKDDRGMLLFLVLHIPYKCTDSQFSGSLSPTPSHFFDDENSNDNKPLQDTPSTLHKDKKVSKTPKPILLVFNGPNPREIMIKSGDSVPLTVENDGEDGGPTYSASLKNIFAEAIKKDSPMKDNTKARFFRAGLFDKQIPIRLGSLDKIFAKDSPLELAHVDNYKLEPFNGMLLCQLTMTEEEGEGVQLPTGTVTVAAVPAAKLIDGASKPLEVAQNRAVEAAPAQLSKEAAFPEFLGEILGARKSDWPNADLAIDVRTRYLAVIDAVDTLKNMGWNKSGGGYMVPWDYKDSLYNMEYEYKGYTFTKDIVLKALRIGHAVAGTDKQTMSLVEHCSQASTWFEDPNADEDLAAKFNNMKNSVFRKRLERKKEDAVKRRAKDKARQKAKEVEREREREKRRRRRSDDRSADEAGPSKKKSKSKKTVELDGMDESDD